MDPQDVIDTTEKYICTRLDSGDDIPIVVAIADPNRTMIGISIQRNYPLSHIERGSGIPYAKNIEKEWTVTDPDELHGYKWSIDTHESVFEADAANHIHLRDKKPRRIQTKISTGLGNVLQNMRVFGFVDSNYYEISDIRTVESPYACLIEYATETHTPSLAGTFAVYFLYQKETTAWYRQDKNDFLGTRKTQKHKPKHKHQERVRWAVSGYPLLLQEKSVPLNKIAQSITDYRHIWGLPQLKKSLIEHLAKISTAKDRGSIDFYFGIDQLDDRAGVYDSAIRGESISVPTTVSFGGDWLETLCIVCEIDQSRLGDVLGYDEHSKKFTLNPTELMLDFVSAGYKEVQSAQEVTNEGQFFINSTTSTITVILRQAIYPHHLVGITNDGLVVNISICGQSGRSGITLESAKQLCCELKLKDALIFDNGNDVFARFQGRHTISHVANKRQTRLTAALHFATILDPLHSGGCDIASKVAKIRPPTIQ